MIKVTIRQAAKTRGLKNAYQFGQSIGVSRMVAARIWKNDQPPKLKTLDRICNAWGCGLEELIVFIPGAPRSRYTSPRPQKRVKKNVIAAKSSRQSRGSK